MFILENLQQQYQKPYKIQKNFQLTHQCSSCTNSNKVGQEIDSTFFNYLGHVKILPMETDYEQSKKGKLKSKSLIINSKLVFHSETVLNVAFRFLNLYFELRFEAQFFILKLSIPLQILRR